MSEEGRGGLVGSFVSLISLGYELELALLGREVVQVH